MHAPFIPCSPRKSHKPRTASGVAPLHTKRYFLPGFNSITVLTAFNGSGCCSLMISPVSLSKQCNAALNVWLNMCILAFRFCIGCQVGTQYLTHRPLSIGKACISFLVDWLLCIPINEAIDDTDERRTEERGLRSEERRVGKEGRSRWAPDH